MICVHCECEFDPMMKKALAKARSSQLGRVNECIDCATPGPQMLTGVMIYGHKTAGSIQINRDPALTDYMLKSSPSAGTKLAMGRIRPKTENGVHHFADADIAKRR